MAVFDRELNWSEYQNQQLNILKSINKSLETSLNTSDKLNRSLSSINSSLLATANINKSTSDSLKVITYSVTEIARSLVKDVETFNRGLHDVVEQTKNSGKDLSDILNRTSKDIEDSGKNLSDTMEKTAENLQEKNKDLSKELKDSMKSIIKELKDVIKADAPKMLGDLKGAADKIAPGAWDSVSSMFGDLKSLGSDLGVDLPKLFTALKSSVTSVTSSLATLASNLKDQIFRNAIDKIDSFSRYSNELLRLSGGRGSNVKEFRGEFLKIVGDLNKETGYLFSPLQSYQQVIGYSQGITSDLDAIKEMAEPLLLASESLDININSVADLFNRFYIRYAFNSTHMEDVLNGIRMNTANNSADAQSTIESLNSIDTYLMNYAGQNTELLTEKMEEVSATTSRLDAMGVSYEEFNKFFNAVAGGNWADNPKYSQILTAAGINLNDAVSMARDEFAYSRLADAYLEGIRNQLSRFDSDQNGSISSNEILSLEQSLANLVPDLEEAMNIYNLMSGDRYLTAEEFALEVMKNPSLKDIAEDKYVSAADKTNNWLEQIYGKLASLQESLGFGFSDAALLALLFRGVGRGGGGGSGILSQIAPQLLNSLGSSATGATGATATLSGGGIVAGAVLGAVLNAVMGLGNAGLAYAGAKSARESFSQIDTSLGLSSAYLNKKNAQHLQSGVLGSTAAGLGIAGALAALAGPGAGLALGPGALALAAVSLIVKDAVDSVNNNGAANAVEEAYAKIAQNITDSANDYEDSLLNMRMALDGNADLEDARAQLIATGMLSAEDEAMLFNMSIEEMERNKDSLKELTKAYMEATDQWEQETKYDLNKYKVEDKNYAEELWGSMEELLQEWNDSGALKEGSAELQATKTYLQDVYASLNARIMNGEELDKNSMSTYKELDKAFKDGVLSQKEANDIIDHGLWNSLLQETNMTTEDVVHAVNKFRAVNDTAAAAVSGIEEGLVGIPYHGTNRAAEAVSEANKLLAVDSNGNPLYSREEAIKILDDLASKGYHSSEFEEIGEAAALYGLTGYSEGSNYITHDQVAVLHEGEAVVPKKFNPRIFRDTRILSEYLQELLQRTSTTTEENDKESLQNQIAFIEEIREIKEFLKVWKSDKERADKTSEMSARSRLGSGLIQRYFTM